MGKTAWRFSYRRLNLVSVVVICKWVTTQRWIWLLASLRSMAVLSSRAHELQSREKNKIFLSPRRVSPFLAWSDFHARSSFARSTIPEEKWGIFTTVNKRSPISSLCLSTSLPRRRSYGFVTQSLQRTFAWEAICQSISICSFHHCYLCLPRLHENNL